MKNSIRTLVLALAVAAGTTATLAAPAFAQDWGHGRQDGDRGRQDWQHGRDWRAQEWRDHHRLYAPAYAPAPYGFGAPGYAYAAPGYGYVPPPVGYAPQPGFTLSIPLTIR